MPNYNPSNLAIGQASLAQSFQKGELRFRDPVVWKSLIANQMFATPDYVSLRTREDRAYQVDFFTRTQRALGSGRSHTHSGVKGDTQIVSPAFVTVNDDFYTSLKQADANRRTLQEMFNNEMLNTAINFVEGLEVLATDYLFSNRSGVNGVTAEGTFNAVSNTFDITNATSGDRSVQITNSTMDILKYQGMGLDLYCDTVSYNKFKYDFAQGGGNSANLNFQFQEGNNTYYHAPELNASADGLSYTKGYWLAVPKGMVVALDWIPKQNREGIDSASIGGVATYGNMLNPIDGVTYATHTIWNGADETANNGYTQDTKEDIEISLDYAFEKAPLTVANETVIQAFGLV